MTSERNDTATANSSTLERLQKVLAARGVASRRAAEEMIIEGRVSVDGRVVTELGTKVDPQKAVIRVGGRILKQPPLIYYILNKPRGYITTASDPEGRRTIYELLDPADQRERVYPVGRLDMDSEGLLLLTNDGELAHRVSHPRYRIDKEYNALVDGSPAPGALARLAAGGFLVDGGRTSPADVSVLGHEAGGTWLRVIIHEGRKRQVRRMMEEIGHPVRRLRRVRLGQLTLAGLPAAAYRPLTPEELTRLKLLVGLEKKKPTPKDEQRTTSRPRDERAPTQTLGAGRPRSRQGHAGQESSTPTYRRTGDSPARPSQGRRPQRDNRGGGTGTGGGRGDRKPERGQQRRSRP